MKPQNNKRFCTGFYSAFITVLLMVAMAYPVCEAAGDSLPGGSRLENKTLDITSDRLVANQNTNYILFAGHVKAIYGDMTITSDNLKVFYTGAPGGPKQLNRDAIDKIIATGAVIITFGDKTAQCDKAVYYAKTDRIILTGDNTRVVSGKNYITGQKITVCQDTGQITVDGNTKDRVNAVFAPEKTDAETAESSGE